MGRTRALSELKGANFLSPPPQPYLPSPPNNNLTVGSDDSNVKDSVSPSVLLIIIILAIIFFLSGLLHLLVRYLWRPQTRDPDELDDVTVLQGQLQQLFHLHDSGVDQSFIDTLPVFVYNSIIGLKTKPFDCAVCLSEFEPEDKLRLLPKCSHAFHMGCIDTWLLSHSTCPICRACLLNDVPYSSPIVLVLESGSDNNSREIDPEVDESGSGSTRFDPYHDDSGEVVTVKLGKIRNVDDDKNNGEGSSRIGDGSINGEARRCFSMGSFAYVMDESTLLHVPIRAQIKKKQRNALLLNTGNRLAMSECDFESRRDFRFCDLDGKRVEGEGEGTGKVSSFGVITRKESLSVSKIWLREKKEKRKIGFEDSTRRAVSFRFPLHRNVEEEDGDGLKERNGKLGSRSTISEMDITKWEDNGGGSEFGYDDENQSCYSVDSWQANSRAPSFARRTLLWLTGKQNKVVHSSSVSGDM